MLNNCHYAIKWCNKTDQAAFEKPVMKPQLMYEFARKWRAISGDPEIDTHTGVETSTNSNRLRPADHADRTAPEAETQAETDPAKTADTQLNSAATKPPPDATPHPSTSPKTPTSNAETQLETPTNRRTGADETRAELREVMPRVVSRQRQREQAETP
ncbi:hypothetical protein AB0C34_16880 [Nocardia sp. NPDC049220]|uniref:hypothetical protein n=1 Tax=Nocardia sp. NPDC049220 TaxID=3155273 RepID=UPI0033C2E776